MGSTNINDRSMLGSRDSEIAVLIADTETEQHDIDGSGKPKVTRNFARMLRKALWNKIFGIAGNVRPAEALMKAVEQPANPASWKAIQQVADANTALYEAAFPFIPRNKVYGGEADQDNFASIWPIYHSPKLSAEEAKQLIPFDAAFWEKAQHKPGADNLDQMQGFIVA